MTLTATFSLSASGVLTKDDTVSVVSDPVSSGSNSFPDLTIDLTDGTGALQANNWARKYFTLAATTMTSYDLVGTDVDPFGAANNLTRVVAIVAAIVDPDGVKALRIGPQAQATPFSGPFNATTSYVTFGYWQAFFAPTTAGWVAAGGSTDKLYVYNPGAASVDFVLWVLGA